VGSVPVVILLRSRALPRSGAYGAPADPQSYFAPGEASLQYVPAARAGPCCASPAAS